MRENRPRHFWAGALVASASLFGMVAAFGTAPDSNEIRDISAKSSSSWLSRTRRGQIR
jgi:hypothetical protein